MHSNPLSIDVDAAGARPRSSTPKQHVGHSKIAPLSSEAREAGAQEPLQRLDTIHRSATFSRAFTLVGHASSV